MQQNQIYLSWLVLVFFNGAFISLININFYSKLINITSCKSAGRHTGQNHSSTGVEEDTMYYIMCQTLNNFLKAGKALSGLLPCLLYQTYKEAHVNK